MVCTSLGSLLRPLFYFLCSIQSSTSTGYTLIQYGHRRKEISKKVCPRLRELAPRSGGGMTTNFFGHLCTYVIRTTCQVGRGHSMTDQMTPRAGHARARSRSLSLGLSTLRLSVE